MQEPVGILRGPSGPVVQPDPVRSEKDIVNEMERRAMLMGIAKKEIAATEVSLGKMRHELGRMEFYYARSKTELEEARAVARGDFHIPEPAAVAPVVPVQPPVAPDAPGQSHPGDPVVAPVVDPPNKPVAPVAGRRGSRGRG